MSDEATEDKRLNIIVAADIHRRLRIAAAEDGTNIRALVVMMIKEGLDRRDRRKAA